MQILFCNYEYPPLGGGGGVVMAALARELADRGHGVTVLTSQALGLPARAREGGVDVVRVPVFFRRQQAVANLPSMASYLPSGLLRGLKLARERQFDVINTHFVVPTGPLGDWLSRRLQIPNVLSVHGGDLFDPSKPSSPHRHAVLRAPISALLRRADLLVAQSRDTAENVSGIYGVRRPVERVPLGIARPPKVARASRGAYSVPEDALVLVTVGRLVPRKAMDQLVDVLSAAALPNALLLIIGDGPEAENIARAAHERGVHDRVRLLGHLPESEKHALLQASDVFVSTSQHEGFGLVYLEAMAHGLPIICYDRGGQTDFLATPANGYVVALNDIAGFTAAVVELARSPERRHAIGEHNRAAVETFFIDTCARRYEALFEQAIAARTAAFTAKVR